VAARLWIIAQLPHRCEKSNFAMLGFLTRHLNIQLSSLPDKFIRVFFLKKFPYNDISQFSKAYMAAKDGIVL
jgi:hypothetical protein